MAIGPRVGSAKTMYFMNPDLSRKLPLRCIRYFPAHSDDVFRAGVLGRLSHPSTGLLAGLAVQKKKEMFNWMAILLSNSLGTACGVCLPG